MSQFNIEILQQAVNSIPYLPQLVSRIKAIDQNSPNARVELESILSDNPELTTKTLKVVNTIYYSYPDPIASLGESVTILGYPLTRNILITTAFIDSFRQTGKTKFDRTKFWKHSLATAQAAKSFAQAERGFSDEETRDLYLAALLHDVGMIILESYFPEMFQRVLHNVTKGIPYVKAEEEALGEWGHTVIGQIVAELWEMPDSLSETAARHHEPDKVSKPDLSRFVALIHLAHYASELAGFGVFPGTPPSPLNPSVYDKLNLNKEQVKNLTLELLDKKDELDNSVLALIAQSQPIAKKPPSSPQGKKRR